MNKFGRTYKLSIYEIETDQNPNPNPQPVVQIQYPISGQISGGISLDMNIERNNLQGSNSGALTLYNLGPDKRRLLYHAPPPNLITHKFILKAGYLGQPYLPTIFVGQIIEGQSHREGPDWITQLKSYESILGIQAGTANFTFPKNQYTFKSIIEKLASGMPLVNIGFIADVTPFDNSKAYTSPGESWGTIIDLARQYNMAAYIDGEALFVVPANTFTKIFPETNVSFTVSAATGLLNTPLMYAGWMSLDMIFEPRAKVGALVTVNSTEKIYNGNWQISGITHRGLISPSHNGKLITRLSLLPCNVLQNSPLATVAP